MPLHALFRYVTDVNVNGTYNLFCSKPFNSIVILCVLIGIAEVQEKFWSPLLASFEGLVQEDLISVGGVSQGGSHHGKHYVCKLGHFKGNQDGSDHGKHIG